MSRPILVPVLLINLAITACGAPKDPEHATEQIGKRGAIRVGVSDNPPWVRVGSGEPEGIEPALVRGFARQLGVRVLWVRNGESALFKALEDHRLDLVAGGLLKSTPWKTRIGLSQPYLGSMWSEQHVLATAPGENRLLLELDRFLASRKPAIPALVQTEQRQ